MRIKLKFYKTQKITQTYIYIHLRCIYIYINKSLKSIAKINQTRAQAWSNLPTSRPFYSRHANANGSWSLDFLDSNRQAKSSAVVRDLKIVRLTKYRPTLNARGNSWRPKSQSCQVWLGQLLAQIMSWGCRWRYLAKCPQTSALDRSFQLQQCQNNFGALSGPWKKYVDCIKKKYFVLSMHIVKYIA